jgi:adenylate cyclase
MSVTERLFPNWSMRTIRLGETNGMILQAVRIMLENITQSHRIIERYTQPSVLQFLTQGLNPLEIPVKKTRKIILFGDMVAFSTMSQKFPVEEVTTVVNAYLEVCCRRIVQHGGEVTKYIGDCVMAHFPPDYADAAIKACLEALDDVRRLRQVARERQPMNLLYCGFGLSVGEVIQGNIGSTIKMDYTVLGDTVNLAAQLEALTRKIRRAIALSEPVQQSARNSWPFVNVGQFALSGQGELSTVYSLHDPLVTEFKEIEELTEKFESDAIQLGL